MEGRFLPSKSLVSHLYSLFSSLHIINKLGLYINSRYWGKKVIKLLNLTKSVYNFSNNGSEIEKSDVKTSTWARKHAAQGKQFSRLLTWHIIFSWTFGLLLINSSKYYCLTFIFSPHQRNIACEYKLYGKPIKK